MLTRHLCFYRVPNTHFYEGALFGSPLCTRANWHSQWQCSREVKHLQCRQHLDMSISGRMLVNFEKNCNYISISQPLTIWRIQNASPAKMIFQRKWDKFRNKLYSLFSIRARKKGHIFTHPVKSGTLLNATFFCRSPLLEQRVSSNVLKCALFTHINILTRICGTLADEGTSPLRSRRGDYFYVFMGLT